MPKTNSTRTDAIAMLRADHAKVTKMFKEFERLDDDEAEEKAELVNQICTELTVHTQIEEEIFYPAVREAIEEDDLMDEALVEHASAKELISQLQDMRPGDEHYDAKVTVLGEYIKHHVAEEQDEMFPKVKKSDLDIRALGEEMLARKQELLPQAEMPAPPTRRRASTSRATAR